MDVVYFVQHNLYEDLELQFSLRSVAQHLPWIRKVWIFGDRPKFLSDDRSKIEHIPWEAVAWVGRFKTPVRNMFLQYFLTSLWRTYDWLKQLGYTGFNFVSHLPVSMTKQRVFEAYADLEDYVTEDRYAGMLAELGILNHAYRKQSFPQTLIQEEGLYVGFHHKAPTYEKIVMRTRGKLFLNFDDTGFNDDMRRFVAERFPRPCFYEKT